MGHFGVFSVRFYSFREVGCAFNVQELPVHQREDAVASLEYEAQARVQDPVYGCVGILCILQVTLFSSFSTIPYVE